MSLRARLERFVATAAELDAAEMRKEALDSGFDSIQGLVTGQKTEVSGTLKTVLYVPAASYPHFEAELFDGSGVLLLRWLGRRSIRGISPGVALSVSGRIVEIDGRLAMFNPEYQLLPKGGAL